MFYLTTHSTHFIYGYMASNIWLRTILIVRKETRCRHIGYSFRLTARVLLYAPSHRQDCTYHTAFVTPVVEHRLERELAQWVHPMKDRSDDPPHHERTLLPRSYISLLFLNPYHESVITLCVERDVAQSIACPPLKRSVVGSILLSGPSCSLGYFPFQPVVHNWFIKGRGMYCSVYGKVHIKDPLLLIEKSSLCGGSRFPSKKCVNVTV